MRRNISTLIGKEDENRLRDLPVMAAKIVNSGDVTFFPSHPELSFSKSDKQLRHMTLSHQDNGGRVLSITWKDGHWSVNLKLQRVKKERAIIDDGETHLPAAEARAFIDRVFEVFAAIEERAKKVDDDRKADAERAAKAAQDEDIEVVADWLSAADDK